jgi:hypothetical protein
LFHALREGTRVENSDRWLLTTMQPKGNPIEQLAQAIERLTKTPGTGDPLRQNSQENPLALHQQAETLLSEDPSQRFVLLVDQFEELFTQTKDAAVRQTFINLLTEAAQAEDSRCRILISLRSDFVSNCASHEQLRELISQQFQLVGAMAPRDLAKAITLPALEVGAEIDPKLVSQIIADMKGSPDALPLMSFALRDLFEAEKSKKGEPMDLTLPEYVQRGGLEKALEEHANKVFNNFTDEQKEIAKNIFSKLIEVGQGRVDTRRTATFAELVPTGSSATAVTTVLSGLADVRLVTTSDLGVVEGQPVSTGSQEATVTIAHEKMIDAWPWLRTLVDENRDLIALQNQINNDAKAWAKEQDKGYLYRGAPLAKMKARLAELKSGLNELAETFIQACLAEEEAERKGEEERIQKEEALRQEQANAGRFRRLTRWLTAVAIIALIATIVALIFLNDSVRQTYAAQQAQGEAIASEREAVAARATSDFNAEIASTREAEAVVARATSEFNAELAVTSEADAVLAQGAAQAEAFRAANAEATAVSAQATSEANAIQAIDLAQIRLADSNHLSNVIATIDDSLATQEAFFATDEIYQSQFDDIQRIRSSLNTVFAQNLQIGLNINPDAGLNPDVNKFEDVLDGLNWVRFPIHLSRRGRNIEETVNYYEPIVEAYALRGISILFVINQDTFWGNAPWNDDDEDAWAAYADNLAEQASSLTQAMSERYAKYGALIAYEVWNEPDLQFSPSTIYIPPKAYAVILERTASAIKSASPDAKIIFGSLATGPENGISYVRAVQAELGGELPVDAIGLHPYGHWGTFAPFNWEQQFGTFEDLFDGYLDAFPDMPFWVTEIGIASDNSIDSEYYPEWSTYLIDVYQHIGFNYAREVPVVIWFAWSDLMLNAGIVDANGNPKEFIYDAFADVRNGAIFDVPSE